jgi:hypothetical protein
MRIVGDFLTAFGATAGIAIMLIMALTPLLVDLPVRGERGRREPEAPAQRLPMDLRPRLAAWRHAAGPRG